MTPNPSSGIRFVPTRHTDGQTDMRKKYCYVQPHCGKLKIGPRYIIWSVTGLSWLRTQLICRLNENGSLYDYILLFIKNNKYTAQYHNSIYIYIYITAVCLCNAQCYMFRQFPVTIRQFTVNVLLSYTCS